MGGYILFSCLLEDPNLLLAKSSLLVMLVVVWIVVLVVVVVVVVVAPSWFPHVYNLECPMGWT